MAWANFVSAAAAAMQNARARSTSLLRFVDGTLTRSIEAAAVDPRTGYTFYDLVTPWPGVDALRKTPDKLLLVEAARTNLAPVSADFSDALWSKAGATVTQTETAPDGTPAWTITDSSGGYQTATLTWTAAVTGLHVLSCFVLKDAVSSRVPSFGIEQTGTGLVTGGAVRVDLRTDTGAAVVRTGTTTVTVEDAGDWWRLVASFTVGTAGTFGWRIAPASGTVLGATDVAATGSVTPWNVQVEAGAHASSPIRTSGTAVTRDQDLMRWAGGVPPTELLTEGFEIDFYPSNAPGVVEARIGWQSASSVYLRLATVSGTARLSYRNGGSVLTSSRAIPHQAGDKLTLRLEHGVRFSVRVNDGGVEDFIDISAETDWSGRAADNLQLGGNGASILSFGLFSEFRSLQPEPELLYYSMMTFTRTGEASAVDPRNGWAFYQTGFAAEPSNYLLAETSDFVTGWTNGATVTTANTHEAPDSTITADTLTDDDGASLEQISRVPALVGRGSKLRLTCYVRKDADTTRFPEVGLDQGGKFYRAQLNTSTGAHVERATTAADVLTTVTDAGDYWLLTMVCTADLSAVNASVRVFPAAGDVFGATNVATVGTIIVAQMKVVEFYDLAWMPTNTPRITPDNMILIEGARTNTVVRSGEFDHAAWTLLNSPVVTPDDDTAPDGGPMDLLTFAVGGSDGQIRQLLDDLQFTDGGTSQWSIFVRGNGVADVRLFFRDKALATALNDTVVPPAEISRLVRAVANGTGGGDPLWALIESTDGAGFHVWGAQCEPNCPFPSSPIRTQSVVATRNLEQASWPTGSWDTRLAAGQWVIDWTPSFSSADAPIAGLQCAIVTIGASAEYIRIRHTGAAWNLDAVRADGNLKGINGVAFDAGTTYTLEIDHVAGTVRCAALGGSPIAGLGAGSWDTAQTFRLANTNQYAWGLLSLPRIV